MRNRCPAGDVWTLPEPHLDNAKARELAAEAHELAGWSPRVAATRARLGIS